MRMSWDELNFCNAFWLTAEGRIRYSSPSWHGNLHVYCGWETNSQRQVRNPNKMRFWICASKFYGENHKVLATMHAFKIFWLALQLLQLVILVWQLGLAVVNQHWDVRDLGPRLSSIYECWNRNSTFGDEQQRWLVCDRFLAQWIWYCRIWLWYQELLVEVLYRKPSCVEPWELSWQFLM